MVVELHENEVIHTNTVMGVSAFFRETKARAHTNQPWKYSRIPLCLVYFCVFSLCSNPHLASKAQGPNNPSHILLGAAVGSERKRHIHFEHKNFLSPFDRGLSQGQTGIVHGQAPGFQCIRYTRRNSYTNNLLRMTLHLQQNNYIANSKKTI